jgi:hypothetical protein
MAAEQGLTPRLVLLVGRPCEAYRRHDSDAVLELAIFVDAEVAFGWRKKEGKKPKAPRGSGALASVGRSSHVYRNLCIVACMRL